MLANARKTKNEIVQWIRDYFEKNGPKCSAVVGISGGKDSTIVAALCVEALGKDRVVGVMMPNGTQRDLSDSIEVVTTLDIHDMCINIGGAYKEMMNAVWNVLPEEISEQTKINLPPRLRMAALYAIAQSLPTGGRVANTCNLSEDYVGYSTKYGDSAGDFSPLANFTVDEVRQIGCQLPIPKRLVYKTPSDGLCGKSDEENLGFTYAQLDEFIRYGTSYDENIDAKIKAMHAKNLHKLCPIPAFKPRETEE